MGHHHSLQSPFQFLPYSLEHRMKENKQQIKSWTIKNKKATVHTIWRANCHHSIFMTHKTMKESNWQPPIIPVFYLVVFNEPDHIIRINLGQFNSHNGQPLSSFPWGTNIHNMQTHLLQSWQTHISQHFLLHFHNIWNGWWRVGAGCKSKS
jgi:hypothetical protein